eukprot:TRINITY_DN141_c0_g1_i3.p2 TRINITY_DN141_c0_g1~~TRINITY_DN141_c0_g1_i3.p2  ORF type:complete len:206 (+),score=46.60 TRINITY_DN141_c0_g1_i3:2033-2650(+)
MSFSSTVSDQAQSSHEIKVGMVGDPSIGKTSLMVKYISNQFDPIYTQTLGVNYMQKEVNLKGNQITFSIWDLGGAAEFGHMLPLVCNEATAILFMFDLTKIQTLTSVREWFSRVRQYNETAFAILIGTKFDAYASMSDDHKREVNKKARRTAKAMRAPLVYSSAQFSINIKKIFKIVLSKTFGLNMAIEEMSEFGHPITELQQQS